MASLVINNVPYKGPDGWSDLNREGLLHLARLQPQLAEKPTARYLLIKHLFGVPMDRFLRLRESLLVQCEPVIGWLYEKNTLSKWLIPSVETPRTTLYGPKSRLADLTAEEFCYTEALYEQWVSTQKEEYLHAIFAYLYREAHWWTGKRKGFKVQKSDGYIRSTKNVPLYLKRAVLINYAGCRNYIISLHPHIWKKAQEHDNETVHERNFTRWTSIFLNLAGDKFGTYDQTLKTDLWLVLEDMEMKAKQVADMEAKK
jgi:hypothetical protein